MGHDHVLTVPISIGPLVLKIAVLAAICGVTAFALIRAFLPKPDRVEAALVSSAATATIVLELMLAPRAGVPSQAMVLLLAITAVPIRLTLAKNSPGIHRARAIAPWIFILITLAAFALATFRPDIGVLAGLAGLSWFALCHVRHIIPRVLAGLLATAVLGTTAMSVASRSDSPAQSSSESRTEAQWTCDSHIA